MADPILESHRATFTSQTGKKTPIKVHFNPNSLQISISNTIEEKGTGKKKKQYISKSSAQLTMDLIFDTTDKLSDVRVETGKIAKFMEPGGQAGDKKIPAIVLFEWGTFKFQGLVESYKETIDFFSAEGVPLRASVNLSMSSQEEVFTPKPDSNSSNVEEAVVVSNGTGQSASRLASLGGAPDAGRALAASNNQETMRFPSGPFTIDPSIQLSPPVAFATGRVAAGASAGAGFSASASASARVSANAGAFAGLRIDISSQRKRFNFRLDTSRYIEYSESTSFSTSRSASFQLGGQALIEDFSSLTASTKSRIQFD